MVCRAEQNEVRSDVEPPVGDLDEMVEVKMPGLRAAVAAPALALDDFMANGGGDGVTSGLRRSGRFCFPEESALGFARGGMLLVGELGDPGEHFGKRDGAPALLGKNIAKLGELLLGRVIDGGLELVRILGNGPNLLGDTGVGIDGGDGLFELGLFQVHGLGNPMLMIFGSDDGNDTPGLREGNLSLDDRFRKLGHFRDRLVIKRLRVTELQLVDAVLPDTGETKLEKTALALHFDEHGEKLALRKKKSGGKCLGLSVE